MTWLAEARKVSKRFRDVLAVDQISASVGIGEVVGLVGANGAGKTTLVRLLLGLLRPSRGGVRLLGGAPSRRNRRRLGYVPQGLGLYADLTVAENLAFTAAAFGVDPPDLDPELEEVRHRLVGEISLGLRRRTAFAAALAHRPELLVLDEPTSGVGPLARAELWETIRAAAEAGAGVLVTTHHMEEAEQCDRLVVMATGKAVAAGTVPEIVGDRRAIEVETHRWPEALQALQERGLLVALAGTRLRLPSAGLDSVQEALGHARIEAAVRQVPASLEEAFVALSSP